MTGWGLEKWAILTQNETPITVVMRPPPQRLDNGLLHDTISVSYHMFQLCICACVRFGRKYFGYVLCRNQWEEILAHAGPREITCAPWVGGKLASHFHTPQHYFHGSTLDEDNGRQRGNAGIVGIVCGGWRCNIYWHGC